MVIMIPDHSECKIFPLKTVFRYARFPLKAGFTVHWILDRNSSQRRQ